MINIRIGEINIYKFITIGIIAFIAIISIIGARGFLENNKNGDVEQIKVAMDDALIQAYALEGNYPTDLEYLGEYGIVFDHDKFYYEYDFIGYNIKPNIIVRDKNFSQNAVFNEID